MGSNFHERFSAGAIPPPSERSTGLVFAVVALVVAVLWRRNPEVLYSASCLAGAFALLAFFAPTLLRPLNLVWFRFSLILHRIVSPIVMFAIFALVFVPGGILMRLWRNPLRPRRMVGAPTYWLERSEEDNAGSMTNQF